MTSSIEYDAFGNPMHLYYGANSEAEVPAFYTGGYQIRQFGAGDASTLRRGANVLSALANPPANMVTAAENADTSYGGIDLENGNGATGIANYPLTANDKTRYFPDV